MKEVKVISAVMKKLKFRHLTGSVIWHSRLNSGKINSKSGAWIQLCAAGTPDIIAIVRHNDGGLAVLFIECKRTGVTKLDYEQDKFFEKMSVQPRVLCGLINDPKQLPTAIKTAEEL